MRIFAQDRAFCRGVRVDFDDHVLAVPRRGTELQGHEQGPASLPGLLQPQAAPLTGDANARGTS